MKLFYIKIESVRFRNEAQDLDISEFEESDIRRIVKAKLALISHLLPTDEIITYSWGENGYLYASGAARFDDPSDIGGTLV